jgi:hypothetical protein
MFSQRKGQMLSTLENRQWGKSLHRRSTKRFAVELRKHNRNVVHQTLDGFAIEQRSQCAPFADAARRFRKTKLTHDFAY